MQLPTQFLVQRQTTMNSGDLFEAIKSPTVKIDSAMRYKTYSCKALFVLNEKESRKQFSLCIVVVLLSLIEQPRS
jgi:hypothetical protein